MAAPTFPLMRPAFALDRARAGRADDSASPARRGMPGTRRLAPRLMAGLLAVALVFSVAEGTQDAAAGKKFKMVTKSFSSSGQIDIPAAGSEGPSQPYPSTLAVDFGKAKKARIKDVNLTLRELSHTYPDNVDVMLTFGNRRATVMSDVGGGVDVDGVQLTLDDEAGAALPNGSSLESGSFRPTNQIGFGEADAADDPFVAPAPLPTTNVALSTFNGVRPDGQWRLFVLDDNNADTGAFAGGWKLEITAKVKVDKDKKDKKGKKGKK